MNKVERIENAKMTIKAYRQWAWNGCGKMDDYLELCFDNNFLTRKVEKLGDKLEKRARH